MTAAVLAVTGQLQGVVAFNRTLGAVAEYSALPTSLPSDYRLLELGSAVLWWPALAVAAGLWELGFRPPATSLGYAAVFYWGWDSWRSPSCRSILSGQLIATLVYPLVGDWCSRCSLQAGYPQPLRSPWESPPGYLRPP